MSNYQNGQELTQRFNRLWQKALARCTFENVSPAVNVAETITHIGEKCRFKSPTHPGHEAERRAVTFAQSWFLHENFRVSGHWGDLRSKFENNAFMAVLVRDNSVNKNNQS